jgi:hypothetical protein
MSCDARRQVLLLVGPLGWKDLRIYDERRRGPRTTTREARLSSIHSRYLPRG